jgi:hypothetical protein
MSSAGLDLGSKPHSQVLDRQLRPPKGADSILMEVKTRTPVQIHMAREPVSFHRPSICCYTVYNSKRCPGTAVIGRALLLFMVRLQTVSKNSLVFIGPLALYKDETGVRVSKRCTKPSFGIKTKGLVRGSTINRFLSSHSSSKTLIVGGSSTGN